MPSLQIWIDNHDIDQGNKKGGKLQRTEEKFRKL